MYSKLREATRILNFVSNPTKYKLLKYMSEHVDASVLELAHYCKRDPNYIRKQLTELRSERMIVSKFSENNKNRYYKYHNINKKKWNQILEHSEAIAS
jgi:predicted transcriptional regulator